MRIRDLTCCINGSRIGCMSKLFPCEISAIADKGFTDPTVVPAETIKELFPECVLPSTMRSAVTTWPLYHNSDQSAALSLLVHQAFYDGQGITRTEVETLMSVAQFENEGKLHPLYQFAGTTLKPDSTGFQMEMREYSRGQLSFKDVTDEIDTAVGILTTEILGLKLMQKTNLVDILEGAFMTLIIRNMFTYGSFTNIPFSEVGRQEKNEMLVQDLMQNLADIVRRKGND